MVTRRDALRVGLTLAPALSGAHLIAACQAGVGGLSFKATHIDALIVDETLGISNHFAAMMDSRGTHLPIVGVRLDPLTQVNLKRAFDRFKVIGGISSGATLFCLERIAWDHGLRLTRRYEHYFGRIPNIGHGGGAAALALQASIMLDQARRGVVESLPIGRAYRPSRADETLHVWMMQKSVGRDSRLRGGES